MSGYAPMTITFRDGETETLGVIEKVKYEMEGRDVLVTYVSEFAEGMTMRYTMTGPNTARTEMGTLRQIN
ncbi:hypothetical protein CWE22_08960 [Pseudidiomarina aestuarii]|uniref:Uncharacterized protein n=2 Tax=Pseudidiomarina aestuarii TaxID=624146 RepID=A0A7Z6ZSP4_9GAMM|nr:hypothetical protein CWE22_08960 [Pseudidiomarina aestuarii]